MSIREYIQSKPRVKQIVHRFLMHPVKTRPCWWIRLFSFLFMKRGKGSVIYRSVRKDITPFHPFALGEFSVIEDFSCINNAVGEITIGSHTRIGLHNTIIGPVYIGNHVNLAQGVVVSGLNHSYEEVHLRIDEQKITTVPVKIDDDVWIGANAIITAGVSIGQHCVIGAGSVVTKNIPDHSIAVGNPARIIKHFNTDKHQWESP